MIDNPNDWDSTIKESQIVHVHGWNYPLALQAARSARKTAKPYILSPLGQLTPGPYLRKGFALRLREYFVKRPLLRSAAVVTAMNDAELSSLREQRVHPMLRLLPYGTEFHSPKVDAISSMAENRQESARQSVLMLDPLEPQYGCVVLLKAFAELGASADGWTITLAGPDRGHWREKLEAAVRRKGGEDRVVFEFADSTETQMQMLRSATALVTPSLHVSPAVSIMRAVEARVPVIATRFVAPPGLNGAIRTCEPSRVELREALRSVMDMSALQRRTMADAAREKAREVLDWSVLGPQYAAMYAACVGL